MRLKYEMNIAKLNIIPGIPFAYWISDSFIDAFKEKNISDFAYAGIGMRTGNNEKYLRFWFEVNRCNILLNCHSADEQIKSGLRWIPYNKGGEFRRWYGNNDYIVNWYHNGLEIKENTKRAYPELGDNLGWKISNENYYFKSGITWSGITSSKCSFRIYGEGFIFDSGANGMFPYNTFYTNYIFGLLNTSLCLDMINVLNPTLNNGAGTIRKIPVILDINQKDKVDKTVLSNINLSENDWNSFETSWDFKKHPLV